MRVIPNFVDTDAIRPLDRTTPYRRELGIGDETVVMYAGNVGFSQSLELLVDAARELVDDPSVVFVINGGGSARPALERERRRAAQRALRRPTSPRTAWPRCWPPATSTSCRCKRGLAASSVPSKTYSILAAGRPAAGQHRPGHRGGAAGRAGRVRRGGRRPTTRRPSSPPCASLLGRPRPRPARWAQRGRAFVERWVSPGAVAAAYEELFEELRGDAMPRAGTQPVASTARG